MLWNGARRLGVSSKLPGGSFTDIKLGNRSSDRRSYGQGQTQQRISLEVLAGWLAGSGSGVVEEYIDYHYAFCLPRSRSWSWSCFQMHLGGMSIVVSDLPFRHVPLAPVMKNDKISLSLTNALRFKPNAVPCLSVLMPLERPFLQHASSSSPGAEPSSLPPMPP